MKPSWIGIVSAVAVVALAACEGERRTSQNSGRNRFGASSTGGAETQFATPTPTPADVAPPTNVTEAPTPTPTPFVSQPDSVPRELPYGIPVPSKPGYVTSPHAPSAGYVDVRGFGPSQEVKCPYSGKIFLVP